MRPITRDRPFKYVNVLCFSRFPPSSMPWCCSAPGVDGAPRGAYPTVVDVRGNSAGVKSKADETEYERMRPGRLAGFALSRGSSFSRDSLLDDVIPDREDDSEARPMSGSDEASEASSRESRGGFWISEKPRCDISADSFGEASLDVAISSWSMPRYAKHLIVRRFKAVFQVNVSQTDNLKMAGLGLEVDLQPA